MDTYVRLAVETLKRLIEIHTVNPLSERYEDASKKRRKASSSSA